MNKMKSGDSVHSSRKRREENSSPRAEASDKRRDVEESTPQAAESYLEKDSQIEKEGRSEPSRKDDTNEQKQIKDSSKAENETNEKALKGTEKEEAAESGTVAKPESDEVTAEKPALDKAATEQQEATEETTQETESGKYAYEGVLISTEAGKTVQGTNMSEVPKNENIRAKETAIVQGEDSAKSSIGGEKSLTEKAPAGETGNSTADPQKGNVQSVQPETQITPESVQLAAQGKQNTEMPGSTLKPAAETTNNKESAEIAGQIKAAEKTEQSSTLDIQASIAQQESPTKDTSAIKKTSYANDAKSKDTSKNTEDIQLAQNNLPNQTSSMRTENVQSIKVNGIEYKLDMSAETTTDPAVGASKAVEQKESFQVVASELPGKTAEKVVGNTEKTNDPAMARSANEIEKSAVSQIIRGALTTLKSGKNEMTLQLRPPELGSVRIKLTLDDNVMTARIVVESEGVKGIIQRQFDYLKESLNEQGVKIERFEVLVGQQYERQASEKGTGEERQSSRGDGVNQGGIPAARMTETNGPWSNMDKVKSENAIIYVIA